jgi:hypothetical protein
MITVIQHAYLLPMLICAILSLKAFRLRWPFEYKIFAVYLWLAVFTEAAGRSYVFYQYSIGTPKKEINNIWIYTPLVILQYLLCAVFFYYALTSVRFKRVIAILTILFGCFSILNAAFIQGLSQINSYMHLFSDGLLIFCVFTYFEETRKTPELRDITKLPLTWISLGIFIFHLLNIPYLISINYLYINHTSVAIAFMYLYQTIIFISYILIIKAFLCPTPPQK